MPAPASSALALASSSHGPGASSRPRAAAAAIARRRSASPGRPAQRRRRSASAVRRPATAGDVGAGELPGGLVVEQLGQRRGDERRHRARRRARADPLAHARPSSRAPRRRARGAGRRTRARGRCPGPRRRRRSCRAASRPRPRRAPCSRAGWRRWPPPAAARARARPCRRCRAGRSRPRRCASSAPSPESPPEQVRMASPPSPRGRAPRTASALASSSSSCTSCAHARAGLLHQRAEGRVVAGHRARCAPRRRSRPAAEAPTLSTATPMPASAHSASASHSRAPSPSLSRKRATERTPSRWAMACSQSPASTTAWLPHETTVCRRRPRRAASALTATLPLCETTATWPASPRHERVAPERRAVVEGDDPVAVGPAHRQVVAGGRGAQGGLQTLAVGRLAEARRVDDRAAAPARAGLLDHLGHARGGDGDDDRVDGLGQVGHGRHAGAPVHAPARRVHAPHAPAEARCA